MCRSYRPRPLVVPTLVQPDALYSAPVTSLLSRVTSLRSSPRSARRVSIVAFWFSARSRVARSRRLSLSAFVVGLRLAGSMLASESSYSRRVTSACRERAFFAVRRTSFVSWMPEPKPLRGGAFNTPVKTAA